MIVISARNRDIITEGSDADIVRDLKYFLSLTYQDNELWKLFEARIMEELYRRISEELDHAILYGVDRT